MKLIASQELTVPSHHSKRERRSCIGKDSGSFARGANKQRKSDVSHERQHARFTIFCKFPNPFLANPVSAGVRKAERDGWPRCSARDNGVIRALSIWIRS